jgi:hypothetical protein
MSLADILLYSGGAVVVLTTIIQVTPIKINPWSWLGKCIGRAINGEVISKVDNLSDNLTSLRNECDEREASLCRTHILRFGDELLHGVSHSQEHFLQILVDIDKYEKYCNSHPTYRNNIANATIKQINKTYDECLEEHKFL